jgi:5'-nucleotidase
VVRALVTNDDGIDSTGLRTLVAAAVEAGLDVVVAAPHTEYSGSSASLTALEADGRLVVHKRELLDFAEVPAHGVEATPAFIVIAAAHGAFGARPDIVLSGVNHGPNTGHAVLHSGTVGATLTAATHGIPGLAVSLASAAPSQWATAGSVARQALSWMLQADLGTVVLNVNVPDVPPDRLRGLRPAGLASFGAVQTEVAETGEGFVTMTFAEVDAELEADTDAALLVDGWATATALRAPCHAADVDLSSLAPTG